MLLPLPVSRLKRLLLLIPDIPARLFLRMVQSLPLPLPARKAME